MAVSFAALPSVDEREREREMSQYQQGLVDTCFEEGQYESGISVLEQLRSPQIKPSELHIRQLLYIALYPPPPPLELHDKGKDRLKDAFEPSTPTKATIKQNQKSPQLPSPQATTAAIRLLTSFLLTNSPNSLGRALPEYGSISEWNTRREKNLSEDLGDESYIAQEARCIRDARNAWLILQEGFIQRKSIAPMTPKGKGKKKRRDYEYVEEEPTPLDGNRIAVVAEHAWPVLDWLLTLFESDEQNAEASGKPRHSSILLSQIPPPQSAQGCRWDAKAALDVIFYCLDQTDLKRKAMGGRLLTSLVNLTSTIYIDMSLFVTSIYSRLVSSVAEDSDAFSKFYSVLQSSPTTAKFKVLLCKQYLTITNSADTTEAPLLGSRPKPQARAIRAARRSDQSETTTPAAGSTTSDVNATPASIASKLVLPSPTEILQLLQKPDSEVRPPAQLSRLKFELLTSYLNLHNSAVIPEQEADWQEALESGQVSRAIDSAFNGAEGSFYRESLGLMVAH